VLQEREVRPVGSNENRRIDIRVLAATNRDLRAAVLDRSFREDLFYRLDVVRIDVPPLRERPADIAPIVHYFLRKHARRLGQPVKKIDPAALDALGRYAWPGNVRELENAIERGIVLSRGELVTIESLPAVCVTGEQLPLAEPPPSALPLARAVHEFERRCVQNALSRSAGNVAEAARVAGVDRSNFRRLLKRHGLASTKVENDHPSSD